MGGKKEYNLIRNNMTNEQAEKVGEAIVDIAFYEANILITDRMGSPSKTDEEIAKVCLDQSLKRQQELIALLTKIK
jgi:hypothetical protein